MIRRILAFVMLLLLAACGTSANPTSEATNTAGDATEAVVNDDATEEAVVSDEATEEVVVSDATEAIVETTEASALALPLTGVHETPMAWGGRASFAYPAEWTVRDTSQGDMRGEVTVFSEDNYNFGVSVNNDPSNTASTAERVLNAMNQTAAIETVEREGRTIYFSDTRGGNAWGAIIYVEGTTFAFIEIVNTSRLDLDPMKETAFAMLLSVRIVATE